MTCLDAIRSLLVAARSSDWSPVPLVAAGLISALLVRAGLLPLLPTLLSVPGRRSSGLTSRCRCLLTIQGWSLSLILTGPSPAFQDLLLMQLVVSGSWALMLSLIALCTLSSLASLAALATLLGLPGALVGSLLTLLILPRLVSLLRLILPAPLRLIRLLWLIVGGLPGLLFR